MWPNAAKSVNHLASASRFAKPSCRGWTETVTHGSTMSNIRVAIPNAALQKASETEGKTRKAEVSFNIKFESCVPAGREGCL
jgi:hypothetical protein